MLIDTLVTDTRLMCHLISQIHWSPLPGWGMRWPRHVCVRTRPPAATWPPCQNLWMMAEVRSVNSNKKKSSLDLFPFNFPFPLRRTIKSICVSDGQILNEWSEFGAGLHGELCIPPQFMIFRTVVVERIFRLLRKSASWPPMGTMIVITMCGTADKMPTWNSPTPIS